MNSIGGLVLGDGLVVRYSEDCPGVYYSEGCPSV